MEPINFKEANVNYKPNKRMPKDSGDLPAFRDRGSVLSCWKMTWRERVSALVFGKIWLCVLGGGQPGVWLKASKDSGIITKPINENDGTSN